MGGSYTASPLSVKRYIRMPSRRLFSGFLTINVISHSDNDDKVDAYEYYSRKIAAGTEDEDWHAAQPWNDGAGSNFTDVSRSNKKLSFGDYDCLVFWVAGGMTLQNVLYTGSALSTGALTGYPNTTSGIWYTGITDYCQNFVKYDLISRINNGYGHAALNSSENYLGTIPITKNTFRADVAGISGHDCTAAPPDYDTTGGENPNAHGGNFQEHIMSCGSYSESGDGENLNTANKNTYFPPVENVKIYGTHRYNKAEQTNGSTPVYSIDASQGGYHETSFWNLVIDVQMRGYDDGWSTGDTTADKEWFKSRVNILFQPFGETANINMSASEHTS